MNCPSCGRELSSENKFCPSCGAAAPLPPKKLKSHMTLAVLTTVILGNWIFGIPAIVFARECELAAENGQRAVAARFSRRALTFSLVGGALCAALWAFMGLMTFLGKGGF